MTVLWTVLEFLAYVVAVAVAALVLVTAVEGARAEHDPQNSTQDSPQPPTRAELEQNLVELVNGERESRGLNPLTHHARLSDAAQMHARDMADEGRYYHSDHLGRQANCRVDGDWRQVSENVGVSRTGSIADLHDAFMESDGHRGAILTQGADWLGVGVDRAADGDLYATVLVVDRD